MNKKLTLWTSLLIAFIGAFIGSTAGFDLINKPDTTSNIFGVLTLGITCLVLAIAWSITIKYFTSDEEDTNPFV